MNLLAVAKPPPAIYQDPTQVESKLPQSSNCFCYIP